MSKFLKLSWRDKWIALQAIGMLLFVRIGLKIWGYRKVRNCIAGQVAPHIIEMTDAIHFSNLANSLVFRLGGNCLHRSLVVWWLLRRYDVESTLHFGIPRQSSTSFAAHVWVQIDDIIINDRADIHDYYAEFTETSQIGIFEQSVHNFRQ